MMILNPKFRASKWFTALQTLTTYSEEERILQRAMQFISANEIKGDYLEFGVYKGNTFATAYHMAQQTGLKDMSFFAFDSFEGLPKSNEGQFEEGQYYCDEDSFLRNMQKKGVKGVISIKGWFKDLEFTSQIEKASIIYIDCDLYKSAVPVFKFITPYLQDGTLIILDDYYCFKGSRDRGVRRAFNEWLQDNHTLDVSHYHKFGWHGCSFIVHKGE